jgi:putative ABC transport system permease protein
LSVVGVVDEVMDNALGADLGPMLYVPYFQQNTPTARISLTIRTTSDPTAIANAVRRAVWSVDPLQPVDRVRSLESALAASVAQPRFRTLLIGLFGLFGLVLACIGVYGVAAYAAQQRTREIGVRMALGADRASVTRFLFRRSMPPILVGSVIGLLCTGGLTRLIASILYKPSTADAVYVFVTAFVLLLCALCATVLPARRAARLSPIDAIRTD